jgi:hypothetical protein
VVDAVPVGVEAEELLQLDSGLAHGTVPRYSRGAVMGGGWSLAAFAPDGGLASAGLAASWGWALNDRAMLQVEAGWDRRLGEIADSPLVRKGSRDAVSLSTGVTWRFGVGGS